MYQNKPCSLHKLYSEVVWGIHVSTVAVTLIGPLLIQTSWQPAQWIPSHTCGTFAHHESTQPLCRQLVSALADYCSPLPNAAIILQENCIIHSPPPPAGASQVKWNKINHNLLGTAHDGDIRIWDHRVSALISLIALTEAHF